MRPRLLIAAAAAAAAVAPAGSAPAAIQVPVNQRLAVVFVAHEAYTAPNLDARVVQVVPVRPSTWTAGLANHRRSFFFDDPGNLVIVLGLRSARLDCSEYLT